MHYPTILVHADLSPAAPSRIALAAQLALDGRSHLIGSAACGVSQLMYLGTPFHGGGAATGEVLQRAKVCAEKALIQFDQITTELGVASSESHLSTTEGDAALSAHALFADLIIVSQPPPAPEPTTAGARHLPEKLILQSGRPVLIVPHEGNFPTLGERPVIAWDGGQSAMRAVTAALPLLRKAKMATVVSFNARMCSGARSDESCAAIALYLARHGVDSEVVCRHSAVDDGSAILSFVAEVNADLLVMGGYGHSRLFELVLRSATRTVLDNMQTPVLMAH